MVFVASQCDMKKPSVMRYVVEKTGWGGRIRTSVWRNQKSYNLGCHPPPTPAGYHRKPLFSLTSCRQNPTLAVEGTIFGDTPVIPRVSPMRREGWHARQDHKARG